MLREKLFKKYYKSEHHDYETAETLSYTDDTGRKPEVAFVYSGRNRGKSFEISSQLIADSWYDRKLFGYIRRNDATSYDIEQYFADKTDFIRDMTDGARDGITRYKGKLYFTSTDIDDNGDATITKHEEAGYFFALSRQASYKSLQYPDVYNLLYEEVLTDGIYLGAEPEKLMNLYSTVRRSKDDFMMWLVSNTVSVVNPYSQAWGIKLAQNKPGDVRLSKLYLGSYDKNKQEKYLLIAAHYLADKDDLTSEDKKKNRNRIKTSIASNRWDEARLYPTMDKSFIEPYTPIETCIFEYDDLMFKFDFILQPNNIMDVYLDGEDPSEGKMIFGFVQRKTSEPKPDTRLYTNNSQRFGPMVTRGFKQIYEIDDFVADLVKRGWIVGADNLTMNDFWSCFMNLKGMLK